jgi:DNA-binding Lrp family transcriptional regulator
MKKLTVKEASEFLGITREAIYNRVRRGSLKSINENGIKYVLVEEQSNEPKQKISTAINSVKNEYEEFLKEQIKELKEELKYTKEKVEKLYEQKDEQLKSILQITLQSQQRQISPVNSHESVIEADIKKPTKWKKLLKVLKKKGIKGKQKKKIIAKFEQKAKKSKNIKIKKDVIFINSDKKFKDIYEK